MPHRRPSTPDHAFTLLREGNERFVSGKPLAPQPSAERIELASGQSPYAVILGCSDSRVPIETIFDQPPGNLFVARVAGNIVSAEGIATIEYGVEVLGAMVVLVLGHSACGAVLAAMQHVEGANTFPGHIGLLAEAIAPAAERAHTQPGDWYANAIAENARACAAEIPRRSEVIRDAIEQRGIRIASAVYDLHTGHVEFAGVRSASHARATSG